MILTLQAAAGAGLVNMTHEVLYIVIGIGSAFFLIVGVFSAMRHHAKFGAGKAIGTLAGAIGLAIVVMHLIGIYQRANQEFEQIPGGVGHSNTDRGW